MTHSLQTQAPPLPFSLALSVAPGLPTIAFRGRRCRPRLDRYPGSGRLRLTLVDADDGRQVAIASLELPGIRPIDLAAFARRHGYEAERLVLIRDWGDNEGLLEALRAAGLLVDTGASLSTGIIQDWARVRVCQLVAG
jgi:hypothetical protein